MPRTSSSPATHSAHRQLRSLATIGLLGAMGVAVLLAVPSLQPVVREIRHMSVVAIAVAIALELASCLSFVVVFRLFFDRVPAHEARYLAWTEMSSGALLPGGGVGGYAVGAWLMSLTGGKTDWIVRRSSALFFLTTAVNSVAVIGSSLLLLIGGSGHGDTLRAWLPLALATPATVIVASLPWLLGGRRRAAAPLLARVIDGIGDAWQTVARPSWRLLGAFGYLFFDIAVLYTTFAAVGRAPTAPELILGYTIGYLANSLPVPGGVGVLDAGLAGALLLYGAPPAHAVAAVLVYHAIAFWIPSLGGVMAYAWLRPHLLNRAPVVQVPGVGMTQSSTLKGGFDDRTSTAIETDKIRMGRIPNQRPRTSPLSRDRSQASRVALPSPPHRPLTDERAVAAPTPVK